MMRNIFLIALLAVMFGAMGIAQPNVLTAQEIAEEDLEKNRPGALAQFRRADGAYLWGTPRYL